MPQRRNSTPPKVTTWGKVSWVLVIAGIFDVLRYFFVFFWFSGPLLAGLYCTSKVGDVAVIGGTLTKVCVAGAAALGVVGFAPAAAFGTVMAIAVGFFGWLIVSFIIFMTDMRAFGEKPSSLGWVFVGLVGSVLIMAWRVYAAQIKTEKVEYAKWEKENADTQLQERNQQAQTQMMQLQAAQQAQFAEEQTANDELNAQEEAVNDAQYEEEQRKRSSPQATAARDTRISPASGTQATEHGAQTPAADDTQFETLKDALSELNAKTNRTQEENRKLVRARQIMQSVSIDPTETDPVLRAAYERASRGQKVSDGTDETRGGFVFNNLQMVRPPARRVNPEDTGNYHGRAATPEEERKAAVRRIPDEMDKAA